MPWRETAPMKERMRFVTEWERDLYSMVELCARYGVSRKTGYKWIDAMSGRGRTGSASGAGPRTIARIGLPPTWQRPSAPDGGSIPAGAPRRSCTG
jgi:transposase-like protein